MYIHTYTVYFSFTENSANMYGYVATVSYLFVNMNDGQHRKCILIVFNFKIIISLLQDAYVRMYVQYYNSINKIKQNICIATYMYVRM